MGALYFAVSLISILSSVMATLGTEGTITLDDVLTEMSSMKNEVSLMRTDMSSMKNEMSMVRTDMSSMKNEISLVRTDMSSMKNEISLMRTDMTSMKNEISLVRTDMTSMKNEISLVRTDMSSMKNEISLVRTDMASMRNDMVKLIQLVEDLRDIHVSLTTSPTLPSTTTTPTSPPLPPQASACSSYTELSDAWRHIDYVNRGEFPPHCDRTGSGSFYTYTNLAWGSWYRFTGAAGTKLPTTPAPVGGGPSHDGKQICGTGGVVYISSGGNPTIQDGIVTRDVCFEWGSYSCYGGKTTVGVAACRDIHGDYFVYQLQPVTGCSIAYCAID